MWQRRFLLVLCMIFLVSCGDGHIDRNSSSDASDDDNITSGDAGSGKGLYTRYCANCHGPDAGGNTALGAPEIRGSNASDITVAIQNVSTMNGLSELLDQSQIADIAAYLAQLGETGTTAQPVSGISVAPPGLGID